MTSHHPRATAATLAFALAVLASAAVSSLGLATPAAAQAVPVTGVSCAPGEGVTVVVDFQGLPGGIEVGCATGQQPDGLTALTAAGFSVGMGGSSSIVCTIDGVPVQGYPYCWSGGGYWSYWKATRGGAWGFSPVGAGAGPLAIDSVEGWSWSADFVSQAPRANEASVPPRTTTTTTTPTTTTTGPTTTVAASSTTTAIRGSTSSSSPPTTSPGTGDPATPGDGSVPGGAVQATSSGSGAAAAPAATPLARTGSDAGDQVAIGTLLLVAGAAAIAAGRRLAANRG